MKFYDLFAGIGGFRLGLERSGFQCVGSCEIDKHAREIYRKNFGDYPTESDIREVDASKLPDFDILTAGFPCQAFSFAGKRMGFNEPRGTLFFEIARIAKEKRPSMLLLENVKGLLSHDNGRTFGTIINTLYEVGYDVEWQIINGKYFLPQNRERVFIIGHSRERPTRKIFPIRDTDKINAGTCEKTQGERERLWGSSNNARSITHDYHKGPGSRTHVKVKMIMTSHTKANIKQRIQDRTETWTTDTSNSKMRLIQNERMRMLTPLECERLMGFPDCWTEGQSNTQRYKMLGNSVIPQIITMIGHEIKHSS